MIVTLPIILFVTLLCAVAHRTAHRATMCCCPSCHLSATACCSPLYHLSHQCTLQPVVLSVMPSYATMRCCWLCCCALLSLVLPITMPLCAVGAGMLR